MTQADPRERLAELVAELTRYRFRWSKERDLQQGIARALTMLQERRALELTPERQLGTSGRIDLLVVMDGVRIGIEVKVDGSFAALVRQLFRYAESGRIDGLLLVSTRSRHASDLPAEIRGIPVMSHLVGSLR